jgi:hypothetical protein
LQGTAGTQGGFLFEGDLPSRNLGRTQVPPFPIKSTSFFPKVPYGRDGRNGRTGSQRAGSIHLLWDSDEDSLVLKRHSLPRFEARTSHASAPVVRSRAHLPHSAPPQASFASLNHCTFATQHRAQCEECRGSQTMRARKRVPVSHKPSLTPTVWMGWGSCLTNLRASWWQRRAS